MRHRLIVVRNDETHYVLEGTRSELEEYKLAADEEYAWLVRDRRVVEFVKEEE